MNIVIIPSGFKESLDAEQVAGTMGKGILQVMPEAEVTTVPMVDGGEGFTKTLVRWTKGTLHPVVVRGPVGQPVEGFVGFLGTEGKKTAVVEMAAAAGLRLVPKNMRDPRFTHTYGVGQLIEAALDMGAERILLGCGDSGTNDGGAGMAEALGVRFRKKDGSLLKIEGAVSLPHIDHIDLTQRDPRLANVQIDVACNWHNVLCGPNGVARVFGPQKGASPEEVEELEQALAHYAEKIDAATGKCVRFGPGTGASGGLGAGASALLGARLHSRYDIILDYLHVDSFLREADLVFTAEGSIDFQTPKGKIPAEIARRAKQYGIPVMAIAGTIGKGAKCNYEAGIDAYVSILPMPATLDDAICHAEKWLFRATESAMRTIMIGWKLAQQSDGTHTPVIRGAVS